ncbi:hypothetical protein L9W92_14270 [Pelotomaculum terephthalicicum JT]|uniref:hypothetical protein n=1 Tax=Pelotomaculum TaxID=191373 RepID=UPI0009CBA5B5|nr:MULTISPECIES: hypothetical protein [Pelotomaculum]MCG9969190.1 hypothetical protein [Pelotomaculum terephthalicicum JT]OPX89946.1 MAG: hypothetical protein A4E54_00780 [Pelotomaculum sp. PtaB.Bin117]OPY62182.1 MAG: hypothetical protein A4E56_01527 [Pelotomaculum sp. PtaU1.Bin065]
MNSYSRLLLILFALAFLCIQVVSYMTNISRHEEKMVKLDNLALQVDKGNFFDLKMDPQVELRKEKVVFRNETIGFILKVLVISGATFFVSVVIRRRRRPGEE